MWVMEGRVSSSEVQVGDNMEERATLLCYSFTAYKTRKAVLLSKEKYNGRKQDVGRK